MDETAVVSHERVQPATGWWKTIRANSSIQTVLALFSALAFVATLRDVSHLAQHLLGSFDWLVDWLARTALPIFPQSWSLYQLKGLIFFVAPVVFILTGIYAAVKKQKPFRNEQDVYLTIISSTILGVLWIVKSSFINQTHAYIPPTGFYDFSLLSGLFIFFGILPVISYFIFRVAFFRKSYTAAYYWSLLATFLFSFILPVVIGLPLVLMFAINPLRCRQVAVLAIALIALLFAGTLLDKFIPESSAPPVAAADRVAGL